MNLTKFLFPLLALCLTLTACGPKENPSNASASKPEVSSSASAPDTSQPDSSAPDTSVPDALTPEPAPFPPLTEEDKAGAQDAAYDYYLGTVFEVHSLTEIDTKEGEITFQVSCSKDGVKADPDRTISLERKNDIWSVVNEGY